MKLAGLFFWFSIITNLQYLKNYENFCNRSVNHFEKAIIYKKLKISWNSTNEKTS